MEIIEYWQKRYTKGHIYDIYPSLAAILALPHLYSAQAKDLLVLGDGYGRNAFFFAKRLQQIQVTNVDICDDSLKLAKEFTKIIGLSNEVINTVKLVQADIREFSANYVYDASFSNFVLHFLKKDELNLVFENHSRLLTRNGLLINSWLSSEDAYANTGFELPLHCFTKQELKALHKRHGFELIEINPYQEVEEIDGQTRLTKFWFTVAKKQFLNNYQNIGGQND